MGPENYCSLLCAKELRGCSSLTNGQLNTEEVHGRGTPSQIWLAEENETVFVKITRDFRDQLFSFTNKEIEIQGKRACPRSKLLSETHLVRPREEADAATESLMFLLSI